MRTFNLLLRNDVTYKLSKCARTEEKALEVMHAFTNSVIASRREELLSKQTHRRASSEDVGMKKREALLDILLQSSVDDQPLTNADIREEVDTFMFAGHDTTTSAVTFALYCIAKHPEVQEKLLREIQQVMGQDSTMPITLKQLNDLGYMDLVLKEAMRMFPPVPLIGRAIEEDIEIRKDSKCCLVRHN